MHVVSNQYNRCCIKLDDTVIILTMVSVALSSRTASTWPSCTCPVSTTGRHTPNNGSYFAFVVVSPRLAFPACLLSSPTNITPSENQHVLHRIDGIDNIPTRRHLWGVEKALQNHKKKKYQHHVAAMNVQPPVQHKFFALPGTTQRDANVDTTGRRPSSQRNQGRTPCVAISSLFVSTFHPHACSPCVHC